MFANGRCASLSKSLPPDQSSTSSTYVVSHDLPAPSWAFSTLKDAYHIKSAFPRKRVDGNGASWPSPNDRYPLDAHDILRSSCAPSTNLSAKTVFTNSITVFQPTFPLLSSFLKRPRQNIGRLNCGNMPPFDRCSSRNSVSTSRDAATKPCRQKKHNAKCYPDLSITATFPCSTAVWIS
jgi:hypothetical protein